ncbi:hypothetical protein [Acetobacter conturbans]|uniref:Uncharacterized protein n=1 Tax=Acetobacter conturbans TaxID=1737472 RepID=A0ABX0K6K5_9PROT|nr:hypothetical protein [Acetobacter conturbans]NHN90283.1 hypothetical protein [Acetobacter conturbans]
MIATVGQIFGCEFKNMHYEDEVKIYKINLDIIRVSSDYSLDEINIDIEKLECSSMNGKQIEYEREFLHDCVNDICASYVVLAYHMWEKSVLLWCKNRGKKKPKEWKKYEEAAKEIYRVDSNLEYVKCIVNFIKHNKYEDADFIIKKGNGVWCDVFEIEKNHIKYKLNKMFVNFVFLVIEESGPQ